MKTVRAFVVAVGRDTIMRELGVSTAAISNAIDANTFPTSWYRALTDLASREGVVVPDRFKWRRAADTASIEKTTTAGDAVS